ncbi:MAG: hypothetical protein U1F36_14685 [Planctomycetota bacterium]
MTKLSANHTAPSLVLVAGLLACATSARAQAIIWGPVMPSTAASDVSTNGSAVVALNVRGTGSPTVNGVSFTGGFIPTGWGGYSTTSLNGSTTGDSSYDSLLDSASATAGPTGNPSGWGAVRIDNLGALTVGHAYEIQVWYTDQRPGSGTAAIYDRVMTLSSAVGPAAVTSGEVTNLGSLVQGPLSGPLEADPDNAPALTTPDTMFGSYCVGLFTWVNANDQLWLLVQGTHPITSNLLRPHLNAFQIRDLTAPSWSSYGAGCAGPSGQASLQLVSLPALGGTFALDVAPVQGPTFMLLGLSQTNLALNFPPFVPNCTLLASPDLAISIATSGGVAHWSIGIPPNATLSGASIFNQAIEFAAVWSTSNAGVGTIR